MIVMKFGGTSVGSAEAIRRVGNIIRSRMEKQPVVVTSAVGGVTNKLVALAQAAGSDHRAEADALIMDIIEKHKTIISELDLDSDDNLMTVMDQGFHLLREAAAAIFSAGRLNNELYDALISMGEFFTANILPAQLYAQGLNSKMVDSRTVLKTDDSFSAAIPDFAESKSNAMAVIPPLLENKIVPVIQGFIGSTKEGRTTTLGRGGSDYSATLLGAMLDAEFVEIWSDVDGVLTADPSLVPSAHRIRYMSFQEAAELAYFGAKVLHPATLAPAVEYDFPVVVLNSKNPDFAGTTISAHHPVDPKLEGRVKSIAYKEGLTVITVASSRMLMAHGFMARLFSIFDEYTTSIDLVSTSEVTVSLTVDNTTHLESILGKLQKIATVQVEHHKAIVCLVGEGLKRTKGIPGQIFGLLQDTHVYSISQGASEINLSFVIDEQNLPSVVTRLHKYFFNGDLDPRIFAV